MEQATGTVTKLVFQSEQRQIFRLKTVSSSVRVLFDDAEQQVAVGDHITVNGAINNHERFGEQLHATQIRHVPVSNDLIADFIMQGIGIGKSIAERILRAFPDTLVEVLEKKDIDALCAVERISRASATVIVNQWHQQHGKAKLVEFIEDVLKNANAANRNRIKKSALKAFSFYKEDTVDKLKDDPFRLWAFSSFKDAEMFARAMKIKDDDERRLICAVEEAIYRKLKGGSTQVYPLEFQTELETLVGSDLSIKAIIAANNSANISSPRIIVKHSDLTPSPAGPWAKEMQEASPHKQLYNQTYALPGVALMEQYVQEQLLLRIEQHIDDIDVSDDEIAAYMLPSGHYLNQDQQIAVKTVLSSTVTAISGGAGTGKTSVLYAVNNMIKKAGQHVLQVALAGKAAQRLIQQTDDDAYTITTLLNKMSKDKAFLDAYDVPVFHIDEASMVDLQTMYRVLKAFKNKPIRLVFIGDWAQLAPIGIGLVFHKLLHGKKVSSVVLKQNFRSKVGIIDASEKIKAGEVFTSNNDVEIIEYDGTQNVLDIVREKYIENMSNDIHVIGARKKTVAECNIMLHKLLRERDAIITAGPEFRVNDAVIYKRNDEKLGLVNGSTGHIVSGQTILNTGNTQEYADLVVDFKQEGVKALEVSDIKDVTKGEYYLQHAYSITCHSGQGSEFDTVIIVVENSMLVERSWLYTAITRAKKKAILIVKPGQIQATLDRGFAFESINSGLSV